MLLNKKYSVLLLSIFSMSVSAAMVSNESMMGYPLDLIVSGKPVKVDSCHDLVKVTQDGGKIDKIASALDNLSNQQAQAELLDCKISAQLDKHGAEKIANRQLNLSSALKHLPASAIPQPSGTNQSLSTTSIAKAYPDLKVESGKAITKKGAMAISIRDRGEYSYKNGNKIHLIDIGMHVTDGTYGTSTAYAIKDDKKSLWQLTPINYNTNF